MAVLLIGSTGNGKSTLGNFLVNPDKGHIFGDEQTFVTAKTNMPETQCVLSSSFGVEFPVEGMRESELTVIDTPGIFEDDDKDIEHMINIIKALHTVGEIRVCIFVVKFSCKIDTPYKASVKYYSKLLPSVFDSNLIIVMTDYACDERSKSLRLLQGIEEDKVRMNIVNELVEVSGIKDAPKIFAIDCLPVTNEEVDINMQMREQIIRHISTFSPKMTKNLLVAKTDSIIATDKLAAAKLEGEAEAYEKRLKLATESETVAKEEVEKYSNKVQTFKKEILQFHGDLKALDTKTLVEDAVWSVSDRWKWFRILSRRFEVDSEWPIQNITYWTNRKCRWVRQNKVTEYRVEGLVKGKFMRGLYAEVKLEVYNCDKHREDINKIRRDADNTEQHITTAKQEHESSQKKLSGITREIKALVESIHQRRDQIKKLSSEYLTMEECLTRFQK